MNGMDNNFLRCDLFIYELQWIPDDLHQTVDMIWLSSSPGCWCVLHGQQGDKDKVGGQLQQQDGEQIWY